MGCLGPGPPTVSAQGAVSANHFQFAGTHLSGWLWRHFHPISSVELGDWMALACLVPRTGELNSLTLPM